MSLPIEPYDPYDDDQRLPDPGRPRMVMLQVLYVVVVAWLIVRALGYLLLFLWREGGLFQSAGATLPPWASAALLAIAPAVPTLLLVVVAVGFATVTTRDWNADDRGGARMLTFIASLIVGALFLLPLPRSRTDPAVLGAGGTTVRAADNPALPPLERVIDRPVELRVDPLGDVLRVTPTLAGTLAGRYRVRTRVTVDATGAELARKERDLELPRFAAYLEDTYSTAELQQGYARWLAQPGATDGRIGGVLHATCTSEVILLAADPSVVPPGDVKSYARMPLGDRTTALSAPVTLHLPAAGR